MEKFSSKGSICIVGQAGMLQQLQNLGYIVNFENNIGHVYEVKDLGSSARKKKLEYSYYCTLLNGIISIVKVSSSCIYTLYFVRTDGIAPARCSFLGFEASSGIKHLNFMG